MRAETIVRTPPLRTYQKVAVISALRGLSQAKAAQVVLPSGSGKTRVFAEVASAWHKKTGQRVLVIAPMRELVLHAEREISRYTKLSVSVEMATRRAHMTTVVCATKHSMLARLDRYRRDAFGLLIFDESDLAAADTYKKIADYFNKAKVYGTTATPDRHDGRQGIAPEVYRKTLREQIEAGYLARVRRIGIKVAEVSRAELRAGDFDQKWLDEIFSREKHLHEVVKAMLAKAGKRPTLVFGVTVLHAKLLANLFNRYRPGSARWVSGKSKDQHEVLNAFRRGEFQFLCNCMLVSRGVDIPPVACIGMAAPTLSHTKYAQMLGRGTRLSPGKKDLLLVDFTFNSDVHAIDAVDVVVGEGREEVGVRARERGQTFDVVDMINEVEGELEADPQLRKRIQAKVRLEFRRIKGIDWSSVTEEMWRTMTNSEIAKKIGCGPVVVGMRRPKHIPSPRFCNIDWSTIEETTWRANSNKTIADMLGVSRSVVAKHRPKQFPGPDKRVLLGRKTRKFDLTTITEEVWRTKTNKEIAKEIIGSENADEFIGRHRPKHILSRRNNKNWTIITDEMWRTMTNIQIAKKMKCSVTAVWMNRPTHITNSYRNRTK